MVENEPLRTVRQLTDERSKETSSLLVLGPSHTHTQIERERKGPHTNSFSVGICILEEREG